MKAFVVGLLAMLTAVGAVIGLARVTTAMLGPFGPAAILLVIVAYPVGRAILDAEQK